jgi:hypothetical protein
LVAPENEIHNGAILQEDRQEFSSKVMRDRAWRMVKTLSDQREASVESTFLRMREPVNVKGHSMFSILRSANRTACWLEVGFTPGD